VCRGTAWLSRQPEKAPYPPEYSPLRSSLILHWRLKAFRFKFPGVRPFYWTNQSPRLRAKGGERPRIKGFHWLALFHSRFRSRVWR